MFTPACKVRRVRALFILSYIYSFCFYITVRLLFIVSPFSIPPSVHHELGVSSNRQIIVVDFDDFIVVCLVSVLLTVAVSFLNKATANKLLECQINRLHLTDSAGASDVPSGRKSLSLFSIFHATQKAIDRDVPRLEPHVKHGVIHHKKVVFSLFHKVLLNFY